MAAAPYCGHRSARCLGVGEECDEAVAAALHTGGEAVVGAARLRDRQPARRRGRVRGGRSIEVIRSGELPTPAGFRRGWKLLDVEHGEFVGREHPFDREEGEVEE